MLAAAYAWLAVEHGRVTLWSTPVHESGERSLSQTVLYFDHFLREVPVDVALALFLAAAVSASWRDPGGARTAPAVTYPWMGGAAAAVLVAFAFWITAADSGLGSALSDLLQFRTRHDLIAYGSHWHYHWLSTLWIGQAAPLVARLASGRLHAAPPSVDRLTRIAWVYFVGATVIWGVSAEVFTSVRYAGHQAREIATLTAVTIPLTLGLTWRMRRQAIVALTPSTVPWRQASRLLIIPVWLLAVMASGDVMREGQSGNGLAAMVAGHVFEHVLDYAFVALAATAALRFLAPEMGRAREGADAPRATGLRAPFRPRAVAVSYRAGRSVDAT